MTRMNKQQKFNSTASRFTQYKAMEKATGTFLGPGVYFDHEKYNKMNALPCSSVLVSLT